MPDKIVDKTKKTSEIDESKKEELKSEDDNDFIFGEDKDKKLAERENALKTKEELLDAKIKEVQSLQETITKEWDEKVVELEALAELAESPDSTKEDLENLGGDESGEGEDENKGDKDIKKDKEEKSPIDESIRDEIREGLEKEEEFREEISSRVEEIGLTHEIEKAKMQYPKMDEREVLLEIEQDPSLDTLGLAKESHERRVAKEEEIRKEVESQVAEEKERSETLSGQPSGEETPTPKKGSGDPWDEATDGAKRDLGA